MLQSENTTGITKFTFKDILCCHRAIEVIVTDNRTLYATYLCPLITSELLTQDLLVHRARQLQKHPADLKLIRDKVFMSQLDAIRKLEQCF